MVRRHQREYALILAVSSIVILASCGRSCNHRNNGIENHPPQSMEPAFIEQPISFCWQKPLAPKRGRVQILVDSSGSMVGFQQAVPPLVNWVQHSISQLEQTTLIIENTHLCQFSEAHGVFNCTSFNASPAGYQPFGDTNLHTAIRTAKDYELTFIITDGVAATGTHGSADCAAGVDAACVARALQDVIHAQAAEGEDVGRGLWVIPLLATYDGIFFTEEPIIPASFNTEDTIQQIRSDIGVTAVVQAPRTGSDGRLVFGYQGPRVMLLIVLARWTDIGRAAVQALWEQTEYLGVRRIEQMRGYSLGLASFAPIEMYPGFLNPVQWNSLQESDAPSQGRGTMDAFFEKDSTKFSIALGCPKEGSGEGVYSLSGSPSTAGQVAGCVSIRLLPAFSFRFRPVHSEDESEVSQFLKGFEPQGESYTNLRLYLACSMATPRFCGQNPIPIQYMAYMNYAKAADGLASSEIRHPVHQQIQELSTAHPSREPHRIYAFSATLGAFYREVAQDQRSIVLANLDFCHKH